MMTTYNTTKQEWENNFLQMQLGVSAVATEQGFLSYIEGKLDEEAQEALDNGESYFPEIPAATVEFFETTVPIYNTDVADKAEDEYAPEGVRKHYS